MDNSLSFEEVLNRDGRLVYTNVGISMMPLIREGRDILVIEKRSEKSLKRFDIVLFKREGVAGRGRYVLHRILKVLPDGKYFIVGDNCTSGETVDAANILGALTSLRRGEKQIKLNGFKYKTYVYFWCAPCHLRFAVLHTKHFLSFLAGAILHKLRIRR